MWWHMGPQLNKGGVGIMIRTQVKVMGGKVTIGQTNEEEML